MLNSQLRTVATGRWLEAGRWALHGRHRVLVLHLAGG